MAKGEGKWNKKGSITDDDMKRLIESTDQARQPYIGVWPLAAWGCSERGDEGMRAHSAQPCALRTASPASPRCAFWPPTGLPSPPRPQDPTTNSMISDSRGVVLDRRRRFDDDSDSDVDLDGL